jgi:hypothetical protein
MGVVRVKGGKIINSSHRLRSDGVMLTTCHVADVRCVKCVLRISEMPLLPLTEGSEWYVCMYVCTVIQEKGLCAISIILLRNTLVLGLYSCSCSYHLLRLQYFSYLRQFGMWAYRIFIWDVSATPPGIKREWYVWDTDNFLSILWKLRAGPSLKKNRSWATAVIINGTQAMPRTCDQGVGLRGLFKCALRGGTMPNYDSWNVIGQLVGHWIGDQNYLEFLRASEGRFSRWSRLHSQSLASTKPHRARACSPYV